MLQLCCIVLHCVAVSCQFVAVCDCMRMLSSFIHTGVCVLSVVQCVAACCSVLQHVAVCCIVLQSVALCCVVLSLFCNV